jgi:chaperonin cofactor prefoldin
MAKSELVQLEHMYANFNQASTLLDLQNVHKKWEDELTEAKKEMRTLKTENIVREKEIGRLLKNSKDVQQLQERLRKEINTVRNRNRSLRQSMEVNEAKFVHLQKIMDELLASNPEISTSKSVLSLELSVLQKQKETLARDLDVVKSARQDPLESAPVLVGESSAVQTPVMMSPRVDAPPTQLQDDIDSPIPLQTPNQLSPVTVVLESRPRTKSEKIRTVSNLTSPQEEEDDDFVVPEILPPGSILPDLDGELTHESQFLPRQLFQASAAAEDDTDLLGSRFVDPVSPSPVPAPNAPKIFLVDDIKRNLIFNL